MQFCAFQETKAFQNCLRSFFNLFCLLHVNEFCNIQYSIVTMDEETV